jgi:hypothetical protein
VTTGIKKREIICKGCWEKFKRETDKGRYTENKEPFSLIRDQSLWKEDEVIVLVCPRWEDRNPTVPVRKTCCERCGGEISISLWNIPIMRGPS